MSQQKEKDSVEVGKFDSFEGKGYRWRDLPALRLAAAAVVLMCGSLGFLPEWIFLPALRRRIAAQSR